ncbi:MAG: hypothetical protein HQK77_19360 [Desulfobacterales bacterium]|nr:hypothetical protein [Desulfobacterales bacterium]
MDTNFLYIRPSFLSGIAKIFDFAGALKEYNTSPSPQIADSLAFLSDWKALGNDFFNVINKYDMERKEE